MSAQRARLAPISAPRPLTARERDVARSALTRCAIADSFTCEAALDACVLIPWAPGALQIRGPRSLIAAIALARRASGITLGDRVFIQAQLWRADGALPLALVVHEVAHVVQFRRDGVTRFLTRYVSEYARHRQRGLSDHEAYLNICYEREAREVEAQALSAGC